MSVRFYTYFFAFLSLQLTVFVSRCSVLDRLNSLLEPGGVLHLTECGTSPDTPDGGVQSSTHRIIRPHPNFRLFLTADPSCGEVSRAMRNRCVEVSLLDVQPAVAADGSERAASQYPVFKHETSRSRATNEHVADLLSLVHAAGLTNPAEVNALVGVHSALTSRRSKGKRNASAGEGPSPRSLFLWAHLVASNRSRCCSSDDFNIGVLLRCMPLAYPALSTGVGSVVEVKIAQATLVACLSDCSYVGSTPATLLENLVWRGWDQQIHDGAASIAHRDMDLLKIVDLAVSTELEERSSDLLSFVLDEPNWTMLPDPRFLHNDAELLHSVMDVIGGGNVTRMVLAQAAVILVRKASPGDCYLRSTSASRWPAPVTTVPHWFERQNLTTDVGTSISSLFSVLSESRGWREVSALFNGITPAIQVKEAQAVAGSRWSPADPCFAGEVLRSLRKACKASPCSQLLLELVDVCFSRRLIVILAERAELREARRRLSSGKGGEQGLGWLGLSCLICEGGLGSSTVIGGKGSTACAETRLARSLLAPYLLPTLRSIDNLLECVVCRNAVEHVIKDGGMELGSTFVTAIQGLVHARDTLSVLVSVSAQSNDIENVSETTTRRQSESIKKGIIFEWDSFLVGWRWLQQEFHSVKLSLSSCSLKNKTDVSATVAALNAACAMIDTAVLQHAGGAVSSRNTLWKHGPKAAAPSSAAAVVTLSRLRRLADEFCISPVSPDLGVRSDAVTLGSLMSKGHPALSVELDTRRELLLAMCTVQWAATNELDVDVQKQQDPSDRNIQPENSTLAERLPDILETTVEAARERFDSVYKGTRLGAANRARGLEHHQDDLKFGEKFDDFDTEVAASVANSTLVVVSGEAGVGTDGVAAGAGQRNNRLPDRSVLQDWALVQLSPLRENWIAVEECKILALLADVDIVTVLRPTEAMSGDLPQTPGQSETTHTAALLARIARLRSVMLATPSLCPSAARPFQTLLWASEKTGTLPVVGSSLLKALLPVAYESFGRRLWSSIVGSPGAIDLQLSPPEMVSQSTVESGDYRNGHPAKVSVDAEAFLGPNQVLTLTRSAFLLRLMGTSTFRSGVVPGVDGKNDVDLTLMNASARLEQFRAALRSVRDLSYSSRFGAVSTGALTPLVQLSWARLSRTLCSFDNVLVRKNAFADKVSPTFRNALPLGNLDTSWDQLEGSIRSVLQSCGDERLVRQTDDLVIPALRHITFAMESLVGVKNVGPIPRVKASTGLGIALLGTLNFTLLLPSSPVDPGLRPALKKKLLCVRLENLKAELTAKRWSLRLDGGGDTFAEVSFLF